MDRAMTRSNGFRLRSLFWRRSAWPGSSNSWSADPQEGDVRRVRADTHGLFAEHLGAGLRGELGERAGLWPPGVGDPHLGAGLQVAGQERSDGRGVAPLVEDVGAQDQVERAERRRLAPIADGVPDLRGRHDLALDAGLDDLDGAGLP